MGPSANARAWVVWVGRTIQGDTRRTCPFGAVLRRIGRLGIVVDATTVDPPLYIPKANIKVEHLRLGDSVIHDPAAVAAYLSALFPKLHSVCSWFGVTARQPAITWQKKEQYRDRWEEVVRLTKIFADVRHVERNKIDGRGKCVRE